MTRNILWALLLAAMVILAPTARADYEAGLRAREAGRPDVALTEWRTAAAGGHRRAMLALGRLFVQGLGAPQDYVEAHMWLNLAAARGEVAAARERNALAAKMTPEQVATAQARATGWRPAGAASAPPAPAPAAADAAPPTKRTPAREEAAADSPPAAAPPSKEAVREAQELLAALGYAPGPADGVWGRRSVRAYKAFLRDSGLPAAEVVSKQALQAMRGKAARQRGSGTPTALTEAPKEASQTAIPSPAPGGGKAVATIAELALQGVQAYMLVKLMEDPERIAGVAPELRRLLGKMVSGVSAADLSNEEDAQVSLGSLTAAERGDLSDLLKKDQGLPQPTRDALSGALRAKAAVPAIALTPKCTGATKGAKCWREMSNRPGCYMWDDHYLPDFTVTWSGKCSGGVVAGQGTLTTRNPIASFAETGTVSDGRQHGRWVGVGRHRFLDKTVETHSQGHYVNGSRHGRWIYRHASGQVTEEEYRDGKILE